MNNRKYTTLNAVSLQVETTVISPV